METDKKITPGQISNFYVIKALAKYSANFEYFLSLVVVTLFDDLSGFSVTVVSNGQWSYNRDN